jgi:hypothetical protein
MVEIDDKTRKALLEEMERVRTIVASVEEVGRAVLDDEGEMEKLRTLIRVTVEFRGYLLSTPPWPHFPDNPFDNMTYMLDKIIWHGDWFHDMVCVYGILVGATRTKLDWSTITAQTLKDRFLSLYDEFVAQRNFQKKLRLLLDLYKLQIVYAGMFYDCKP